MHPRRRHDVGAALFFEQQREPEWEIASSGWTQLRRLALSFCVSLSSWDSVENWLAGVDSPAHATRDGDATAQLHVPRGDGCSLTAVSGQQSRAPFHIERLPRREPVPGADAGPWLTGLPPTGACGRVLMRELWSLD